MQRELHPTPNHMYVSYSFIVNAPTVEEELVRVLLSSPSLLLLVVDRVFISRERQAGFHSTGAWVRSAWALQK